ncbi:uncharacterized protein LOC144548754 [Carex rostrata]
MGGGREMANINENGEMGTEPQPNTWYPLRLGSSFIESSPSTKLCTLRYEFKPASIDKTQPGTLHKNKKNRVSVEFHNNQPGKPKVAFEGIREDYKETDAVLFFDGGAFKLEKLHCAYNSLKHKRVSGESNGLTGLSSACANGGWSSAEAHYPPLPKVARTQAVNRPSTHAIPVEVEKIDIVEPENNAENDGLSAAETLRAQVNGSGIGDVQFQQGAQGQETSSSGGESSSSGSSSASGSGSGSSSSSESEGSDADGGSADSACSPGDIYIF